MNSIQNKINRFSIELMNAISNEKLILPSLPDIALNVKNECEKDDSTSDNIAEIITQDPAMAARLLQISNSSLYRTHNKTENIQMAITKLGFKMVRDLILNLSMKQLYNTSSYVLEERFRELWFCSTKTAAIARLLASKVSHLDAEQAMLAGLIHNIGALPILLLAEDDDDLFDNAEALGDLVQQMQGDVSAFIFSKWDFPDYMIEAANECYDYNRKHDGLADYTDVIQVALIEGSIYTGLNCPDDWSTVPAFTQLGIDTEANFLDIEENKLLVDETASLFK